MKKVLSTKLEVGKIDRFTAMAAQRGQSKSEYLRNLVQDCIDSTGKIDRGESIGRPQLTAPEREGPQLDKTNPNAGIPRCTNSLSNEGLHRKNLIYIHHRHPIGSATKASVTSSLPGTTKASHSLDLPPSSKESLPVYHDDSKGRPEGDTKSTTGKGLLLLFGLILLGLIYGKSPAADGKYAFTV